MNRIIVTPAGRKKYLSVLLKNLIKCKDEFDTWHIWINTKNQEDIDYILEIEEQHDFILAVNPSSEVNTSWPGLSIHQFFVHCTDLNSLYLRIDDDVVFIKKGSIDLVFNKREESTENFLIYGNVLNNVLMSFLQQLFNDMLPYKKVNYTPLDSVGWSDGEFAESIHRLFLDRLENGDIDRFNLPDYVFDSYEHVSINVISWRGDEFAKFNGVVDPDEEVWLTTIKTKELEKPNLIVGDSLFVHYAYYPQRPYMETTDVLSLYERL